MSDQARRWETTRSGQQWEKEEPVAPYCGIDLHSRSCRVAILDERLKVVQEAKAGDDLKIRITAGL